MRECPVSCGMRVIECDNMCFQVHQWYGERTKPIVTVNARKGSSKMNRVGP